MKLTHLFHTLSLNSEFQCRATMLFVAHNKGDYCRTYWLPAGGQPWSLKCSAVRRCLCQTTGLLDNRVFSRFCYRHLTSICTTAPWGTQWSLRPPEKLMRAKAKTSLTDLEPNHSPPKSLCKCTNAEMTVWQVLQATATLDGFPFDGHPTLHQYLQICPCPWAAGCTRAAGRSLGAGWLWVRAVWSARL